ncbi:zf-TFIIB domain-containing protein [Paludibaculum fermentans]|uniref:zf-TFIIB domain-containing protein n=1 Tax=Paludibaculum fermentans TaxID=1473598 RepID=UPI003EBF0BDF
MNCKNCGGALRLEAIGEALACDFCHTLVYPEPNSEGVRIFDAGTGESCPVCRQELKHASYLGKRLGYCTNCLGMLLDLDSFGALVQIVRARRDILPEPPRPLDPTELERNIDCPRCHERMDTHPYAGPGNIVIDNCPDCRLNWLDHNELRRVTTAPDTQMNPDAWLAP